ncbi:MAG: 3-dehydroquinate synthase [Bryobacterales bacterium]|nr:3-dehydroquinate synthase [Bryobacterales bacterium]
MRSIQETIELRYTHAVHFTRGVFAAGNLLLRDSLQGGPGPAKVLFVVDRGLAQANPALAGAIAGYCQAHEACLQLVRAPLVVPGGEPVKNSILYTRMVQEAISDFGICRHSYVVAVGGGAVLDMVGYAAATSHRGVRLVRLPSTVLAQNDSGVGVKNGINAFGKKNFLGTFAPPHAVINDLDLLSTLSDRDWRGGTAEAVKVALIKDPAFFEELERNALALSHRNPAAMEQLIYRCAQLHVRHIARHGDPFESGSSRPLDFGHWAAHKLEQLSGFALRHGEAVAIGMALDSAYSCLTGRLPQKDWDRIATLLEKLGFDLYTPELEREELLAGLTEFQEHLGGEMSITLLDGIGKGVQVHEMDHVTVGEAIGELRRWSQNRAVFRRTL